jgi:hypothetical protein
VGDFVLRTGDLVKVTIPPPAVIPALEGPVPLEGSAETLTVCEMTVCLQGDELPEILRQPSRVSRTAGRRPAAAAGRASWPAIGPRRAAQDHRGPAVRASARQARRDIAPIKRLSADGFTASFAAF